MGIIVAFGVEKDDLAARYQLLKKTIAQFAEDAPSDYQVLQHAVIGWTGNPELFLTYENADGNLGTRGRAIVLGYMVLDRPGRKAGELGQALLNAWTQRGVKFLAELEGSFSLFLYDADKDRYLLATDPMSSRPLWHSGLEAYGFVSSELCYMPRLLNTTPTIDKGYLWSLFRWRRTVGDRSPWEQVRGVEPGQAIEFHAGILRRKSYYIEPLFQPKGYRSAKGFAGELVDSVRHVLNDLCAGSRSPCLLLSGGLDSRMIAALCPESVTAVTLCDQPNREISIAREIAIRCHLKHTIIERGPKWYPSQVEKASLTGSGLWSWAESHYGPLGKMPNEFPHDVVTLGYGCDMYFKGMSLAIEPRVWRGWKNGRGPEPSRDRFLNLVLTHKICDPLAAEILRPEFRAQCRDEYREAAATEIDACIRWASCEPDLWELYQTRSMMRLPAMMNLVCLRSFTSERNVFSSPRLRALSLGIPPDLRFTKGLIPAALEIVGKGLDRLPNATTLLPPRFPQWADALALICRSCLASARGTFLRIKKSRDISSHCSWPRYDRMLIVDSDLQNLIEQLIEDDIAFPQNLFNRQIIRKIWSEHSRQVATHTPLLNLLITFGLVHRHMITC